LTAVAVGSPQRFALLSNVPTVSESGVPGFDVGVWFGIAGPAKTPPDIIARVSRAVAQIDNMPNVREKMARPASDLITLAAVGSAKKSPPTTSAMARPFAAPASSRTRS